MTTCQECAPLGERTNLPVGYSPEVCVWCSAPAMFESYRRALGPADATSNENLSPLMLEIIATKRAVEQGEMSLDAGVSWLKWSAVIYGS